MSGEVRGKWNNLHFLCNVYRIHKPFRKEKKQKELEED